MAQTPTPTSEDCSGPRRRGRPPCGTEATRRRDMLLAAGEIFLEQGFEASSMEAVAKRAGISKKTIYGFVDTKEHLFEAVIRNHMEHANLPELPPQVAGPEAVGPALADYLRGLSVAILGDTAVGYFRLTIAEAVRFPDVANAFFREGALRHVNQLGAWLAEQVKSGFLALDNPLLAARFLTSFIILDPLRAAAMNVSPLPTPEAVDERVRMATKIFLEGCRA